LLGGVPAAGSRAPDTLVSGLDLVQFTGASGGPTPVSKGGHNTPSSDEGTRFSLFAGYPLNGRGRRITIDLTGEVGRGGDGSNLAEGRKERWRPCEVVRAERPCLTAREGNRVLGVVQVTMRVAVHPSARLLAPGTRRGAKTRSSCRWTHERLEFPMTHPKRSN